MIIFGIHSVQELLQSGTWPVERLHVAGDLHAHRLKPILDLARSRGIPVRREDKQVLDRLTGGAVHQGVAAVTADAAYAPLERAFDSPLPCIVVLDGVEDPHNLGAILRTADASGVSGVIVPERHSAPLSATVAKVAAGALSHVPVIRVGNIASTIGQLKERGIWVVGVDADGDKLWSAFDYTSPVALVFGSEHKGLRRLVRERCDAVVRLPMKGKVGALNVSVAAGALLYEVLRQRTPPV